MQLSWTYLNYKLMILIFILLISTLMAACGSSHNRKAHKEMRQVDPTSTQAAQTSTEESAIPTEEPPAPTAIEATPKPVQEETNIRPPQELWTTLSCSACHMIDENQTAENQGPVGPHMGNYAERAGERVADMSAAEYTYTSITDPEAFVLEGYNPVMPKNFSEKMSEAEINTMVSWLLEPAKE